MKKLDLYEIKKDDVDLVNPILAQTGVISNFTCFPQFYAFLKKPTSHLYLTDFKGRNRILLQRTAIVNDIRILFERSVDDEDLIEAIKKIFQPQYIAYNLIPQKPIDLADIAIREELIIHVETVANLKISQVRRNFNRCCRYHPNLVYKPAGKNDRPKIEKFLDEWCHSLSEKLGQNLTAANDRHFLDLFLGSRLISGGIVMDKDKVIGIAFHTNHPINPKFAVGVILKNLRGYHYLGEWLTVQHARQLQKEGYQYALQGGTEVET